MNRYEPSNIRVVAGIAAFAMSALTVALSVYVPASLSPLGNESTILTATRLVAPPIEVAISPARIEVIGVRDSAVASSSERGAAPTKKKPQG